MDKLIIRLSEAVGIVCLIAFIIFVSSDNEMSRTGPGYLSEQVIASADTEGLILRDDLFLKKKYALDAERLEYGILYSSDSVMDVREYMLLKPESGYEKEALEAIEKVLTEKQTLFEDYAPKESALLSSRVLTAEKGYILLAIGNDAAQILDIFRNNL